MAGPRSLVVITADCLRFLGYERPSATFLNSLAADAKRFRGNETDLSYFCALSFAHLAR